MKLSKSTLIIAMTAALPWMSAHAQSAADMQKQILMLQEQLKTLQIQVEAMSAKDKEAVNPTEFNRLVQKMELKEETAQKSGLSDLTLKGSIEAAYIYNKNSNQNFSAGNGYAGVGMFEVSKQTEAGQGINWTLRLTPGSGTYLQSGGLVNEASISVPLGDGAPRVIAGLIPDWTGYEQYFAHQNPLISHNLYFNFAAATSYTGAGLQHTFGPSATPIVAKFMLANIDKPNSNKHAPGLVYNANWTASEYTYLNLAGVHSGATVSSSSIDPLTGAAVTTVSARPFDIVEVDAGYTRGNLLLNGQLYFGKIKGGANNGLGDAAWYGLSGLAGYKITPRLQTLARVDFMNNRKNGGGMYVPDGAVFGPELDSTGAVVDPDRGTTRSALTLGTNYAVNPTTQWKTELRFDRSSGYNFTDSAGQPTKKNTTVGTSLVVSF